MLRDIITSGRLREMQRVETYVLANPHSNSQQIGGTLKIVKSTLNGYTNALVRLGRMRKAHHRGMSARPAPDTFEVLANLGPLAEAQMPEARVIAQVPAQRMDIVAQFFGPARPGSGKHGPAGSAS